MPNNRIYRVLLATLAGLLLCAGLLVALAAVQPGAAGQPNPLQPATAPGLPAVRILLDDFQPQPYQGETIYYFNRLDGDRGAVNDSLLEWGAGLVTTTISAGNTWGGAWFSLNHPARERLPVNFSAILPVQVRAPYQAAVDGLSVVIASGTPGRTFRLELKFPTGAPWSQSITLNGGPQGLHFSLPALGEVEQFVWVLDHAAAGDYVVVKEVSLSAASQLTDTATAAFVWSYAMLLNNWDPVTGLVRDKAKDPSGEFDAIQSTGSLAAATVLAEQLGIVERSSALQVVDQISDTLLLELPRFHGLWPHWAELTPSGTFTILENTEWSSVDTAIAALGLLGAQSALGMDTAGVEAMLGAIQWQDFTGPAGISHGYTYTGSLITSTWDTFGGESWLVELAYAFDQGQLALLAYPSPPTANGSGFIDELAWLFVPPPASPDAWGTDWDAYRRQAAAAQRAYYALHDPGACFDQLGLFGLSAAEVPDPSAVPLSAIYQPFGAGGRFSPPIDGFDLLEERVVIPHYAALIASLHPQAAVDLWAWLIEYGHFSPLNNVESLSFPPGAPCTGEALHWNQLKGSWNLALQALGWGRYLIETHAETPRLWNATRHGPLRQAYLVLVPPRLYLPLLAR